MFYELVAAIAAGAGAAGLVLILNRLTGGRLPRWCIPAGAGLAMIAMAIWLEASWGARTVAALPQGVEVVEEVGRSAWWQPWTYFKPQTVRIMAIDTGGTRTHPDAPDLRLVDLYLFARWQPVQRVPQLIHCSDSTRAEVTDSALADPAAANWQPAIGALILRACKE